MILQELIERFSKARNGNTTLIIQDLNYNDLCICSTDNIPAEYLNLVLIDWDFDYGGILRCDGGRIELSINLEVRVQC